MILAKCVAVSLVNKDTCSVGESVQVGSSVMFKHGPTELILKLMQWSASIIWMLVCIILLNL